MRDGRLDDVSHITQEDSDTGFIPTVLDQRGEHLLPGLVHDLALLLGVLAEDLFPKALAHVVELQFLFPGLLNGAGQPGAARRPDIQRHRILVLDDPIDLVAKIGRITRARGTCSAGSASPEVGVSGVGVCTMLDEVGLDGPPYLFCFSFSILSSF